MLLKHTTRSSILDSSKFHRWTIRSSSEVKNAGELVAFKNEKVLDASDLDTKASQLDL